MTNIYARDVSRISKLDPYRLQELYNMHPAAEHVVKKLLVAGGRTGGKSVDKDIADCIQTLQRWQEMRAEDALSVADEDPLYEWRTAPDAYKWLATDRDGKVFAYVEEPKMHASIPSWNYGETDAVRQHKRMQCLSAAACPWQESLRARP